MFRRRRGLPDDWLDIVRRNVAIWALLDADECENVEATIEWLLRRKHWEPANGFVLTDEMTVTIAANAALLVLGLSIDEYREVGTIIVYPSAMKSRGVYAGPVPGTVTAEVVPILGEAHEDRGPVLLAWDEALQSARNPGSGHNVVFHEFAHKLDMRDEIVDGTPRLDRGDIGEWVEVCTEAFDALRAGDDRPPLQPYGATNPAEFFAVSTEAFFDVPLLLEEHEPRLYAVLRHFFNQDPAARARRAS